MAQDVLTILTEHGRGSVIASNAGEYASIQVDEPNRPSSAHTTHLDPHQALQLAEWLLNYGRTRLE